MNADKLKALNGAISQINKTFGEGTVMTASEAQKAGKLTKRIIPTPSLELNDALHCGGFSGIVELFGANSSGKTSLAIDTIVKSQKEDSDFLVAWLETEGSVTESILVDHGVDLDRLVFVRQEDAGNAESALDILRGLINRQNLFDMIVVNSVAGLAPKKETEDDLDKQNIALIARTMSKFFRVANSDLNKNNITAIFINQTRDNVGQMFGDPATTTGGKALGFYASQRIRMAQNKIMAADPIKEEEGVKINCIIKKNRFAGKNNPFTKCIYYATYENGIDSIVALPQLLLDAGIMRQKGAWWYYEDEAGNLIDIDGKPGKFGSKSAFINEIKTNERFYNELLSKLTGNLYDKLSDEEVAEIEQENAEINQMMDEVNRFEEIEDINQILEGNE